MSDPVKNVEIEDVLSSIRRLVSDDSRREPRPTTRPHVDRFVLTPALRVQNDDAPAQTDSAEDGERPISDDETVDVSSRIPTPDPAAFDSVIYDDLDGDAGESKAVQPHEIDMLSKLVEQELTKALAADPEQDHFNQAAAPATSPAEEEQAVSEEAPFVLEAELSVVEEPDQKDDEVEKEAEPKLDKSLAQKISALEDLIAQMADTADDDSAETEDDQEAIEQQGFDQYEEPVGQHEEAHVETDAAIFHRSATAFERESLIVEEEAQAPTTHPDLSTASFVDETPTSIETHQSSFELDEDMLRDLVGRLVKEELQGVLGERITRNVRMLVRREVHRQLVSQEQV